MKSDPPTIDLDQVQRITEYLALPTSVPERADIAFVFGTRHAEPADIAADLAIGGIVQYVVLTGGDNRHSGQNEASAHLRILLNRGLSPSQIIVEDRSTNTLENVLFARPLVAATIALETIKAVVVVTKWYHSRRAVMTLKQHWPSGINYFPRSYEPAGVTRLDWWRSEGGRRRVLKEWENIPLYLQRGDIAEIEGAMEACGQPAHAARVESMIRVRVRVHGLLTAAVDEPDSWLDVTLPEGSDAEGLVNALCKRLDSPLFDAQSCMATVGGVVAPLDRTLQDGEEVQLYHLFSGG